MGALRPSRCGAWIAVAALLAMGGAALAVGEEAEGQAPGGTLTVLATGDVDHIDPGRAFYSFTYMVTNATQRPLYSVNPAVGRDPVADLAEAPPDVAPDGRTVTVRIRRGVRFSPPVSREVVAGDVKYAVERGFRRSVSNGYAAAYFGDLVGAQGALRGSGAGIPGIEVPDDRTLVFRLRRPTGRTLASALVLPLTAPVPPEYAAQFDQRTRSTYGTNQVATGPYRVASYRPGREIVLERNPSWARATDFRPAHLDRVVVQQGVSPGAGTQRILDGASMVNGDFAPPPGALRRALATRPDQVAVAPASGNRYVALNTRVAPFRNVNVRRAVVAAFDRARVQSIRGGRSTARVASHLIPPGMPGFEEAGGEAGPRLPFLARPRGSLRAARRYLRRARFSPRRATRRRPVLMVGVRTGVARTLAVHARRQLRKLGFRVRLRLVSQDAMYVTWCGVPRRRVAVCPNVGWLQDFNDAQTMLDQPFSGRNITSRFNANWPLLDDRRVNRAIEAAKRVVDPAARARAWGLVDRRIASLAAAVPLVWDMQPNVRSANVESLVNGASFGWDLSFTRLR